VGKPQSSLSIVHSDGLPTAVGMKPRRSFVFASAAGGTFLWRVLNDGFLINMIVQGTNVTLSSEALTIAAAEALNRQLPEIIAVASNAVSAINLNYPIKAGDVYALTFSAVGVCLLSTEDL